MRGRLPHILTLISFSLLFVSVSSYGKNIEIVEVPKCLSEEERAELTEQRSVLVEERDALRLRIDEHNKKSAIEFSWADEELRLEAVELEKAKQKHWDEVTKFNEEVFDCELNCDECRDNPIHAPLTNDQSERSAYEYSKVIDQFKVEASFRYAPDEKTYCNIFVWDVTRAMNAEIPHWVKGKQTKFKDLWIAEQSAVDSKGNLNRSNAIDMNTYQTIHWLKTYGEANGWHRAGGVDLAQQKAKEGHPTVAIIPGHVAIVRPGNIGEFSGREPSGPALAQSGEIVINASHLKRRFPDPKAVEYWYHD